MSKMYFQYQGTIESQAVSEAIAFPIGVGPFMGFAQIDLVNMKVLAEPSRDTNTNQGKYYDPHIKAQNYGHCVGYNPYDPNRYKFGLITKSGHIYVSEQSELPVTVLNSSSGRSELILLALYKNVDQPIINIPTIVGYWNNTNVSFYEDYFLNTLSPLEFKLGTNSTDTPLVNKTFKDLYDQVKAVINNPQYEANMVLLGIYGEGINSQTNETEPFSIVPYNSQYPYSQPFTPAMYSSIKGAIDGINAFIGPDASRYDNLKAYVNSLIPEPEKIDDTLKGVPIGTILMWSGSSIPEGWALCDGTNGTPDLRGRFPIGETSDYPLGATGGQTDVTLTQDHIPAHKHEIVRVGLKIGDNNHHVPVWDQGRSGGAEKWGGNAKTESWGNETPTPISIMNPWCAVRFIMRIK